MIKIMAHRFLSEYDASIYLDNTIRMVAPYEETFARLEGSASPMITFRHPWRSCVYQEAEAVKHAGYDDATLIDTQMNHYRSLAHPANAGLVAGGMLLRRHDDRTLQAVMEQWFHQVCRYSYRDQLSFNAVARTMGFEPNYFRDRKSTDRSFSGRQFPRKSGFHGIFAMTSIWSFTRTSAARA